MSGPLRVLIMAGGTGGHVFPALAVARRLHDQGVTVHWLGSRRGIEARLVPEAGFPLAAITIVGLRGNGLGGWLAAPWRLLRALGQSLGVVRRVRPHVVLGLGGFVTGPGGVAARLLRRPLVIHEQNAAAGLTNRLLAPWASRVLQGFPDSFPRRGETVGNPVRDEIAGLPAPAERYGGRTGPLRLLVIGGSQGALALNRAVPAALAALAPAQRPQVRHQAGRTLAAAEAAYAAAGVTGELCIFIDDMAAAYRWADVVVCRAGALTVSELAAAGVPGLLVPLPQAVDDHQTRNAEFLVRTGGGELLPQRGSDVIGLAACLKGFCQDPEAGRARLWRMAEAARQAARPQATQRVAEACVVAANASNEGR